MSITGAKKTRKRGRGRPRVDAIPVNTRFPPPELAALDAAIRASGQEISRPEAVRRLVADILVNKAQAQRALAGSAVGAPRKRRWGGD